MRFEKFWHVTRLFHPSSNRVFGFSFCSDEIHMTGWCANISPFCYLRDSLSWLAGIYSSDAVTFRFLVFHELRNGLRSDQ